MNAARYETAVLPGGRIEVTLADAAEGTPVEVIVLYRDQEAFPLESLLLASESSLGFWDNPVDDEVWNTA